MYFDNCNTPDSIREMYRKLAKANHPDLGGNTATMQAINLEYERALQSCHGKQFNRSNSDEKWTYQYRGDNEKAMAEAIARALRVIGYNANVQLTLVGVWLWVTGDTRPLREELKKAGFWWNSKRGAWNWHAPKHGSRYNPDITLGEILAAGTRIENSSGATLKLT